MIKRRREGLYFLERSKKRQKRAWWKLKQEAGDNLFTSEHYPEDKMGWEDIYIPDKKPRIYNCALQTCIYEYKEEVSHQAWEKANELTGRDWLSGRDWLTKINRPLPEGYWECVKEQEKIIANSGDITVQERLTLHYDYRYGIGVHASLNIPYLNKGTIDQFIIDWHPRKPFLREERLSWGYDEIEYWGCEIRSIVTGPWAMPEVEDES